jgi:hypothetical protein
MRHHAALTTAAFVFRAEHEELRVALRLPPCKPVVLRVEAVLAKMMPSVEQLPRGFCRVKEVSPENALIREVETLIKQGSHRSSKTRFWRKILNATEPKCATTGEVCPQRNNSTYWRSNTDRVAHHRRTVPPYFHSGVA